MIVEIDGLTIELIRKQIKNIHLRVYPPDGAIRVSAPIHTSDTHIYTQDYQKLLEPKGT